MGVTAPDARRLDDKPEAAVTPIGPSGHFPHEGEESS
jgi:hypothetical protein